MQTKCEKVLNKFIAIILIMLLTLADIITIGIDFVTYAIDMVATNTSNVEFEAYFKDQNGEKVTVTETELQAGNLNVYVDISVKQEGYFNGKVLLENSNFSITGVNDNPYVNSFDANSVTLNQINSGKTVTIEMQAKPNTATTMNADVLNKDTQVKLQGTYVSSKGNSQTEGVTVVTAKFVSSKDIKSNLDAQILTNKVYEIEGTNKRVVQILVKSKIEGNIYPVKKDSIKIDLPTEAESVEVTARSTKGTNPNIVFGESNYTVSNENTKLEINVENNQDQNGLISFEQNAKDEFVVTCVYAENKTFENIDLLETQTENQNATGETKKAPIEITQEILTYDEKTLSQSKKLNIDSQIDGIVTHEITEQENEFYKGKLYTGEERTYNQNIRTYINSTKVQKNISFTLEKTNYISGETKKQSKIAYKEITIKKQDMTNVLGEDGFITIKGEDNTVIANITKETEAVNGYIVTKIPENIYKLQIETSNSTNVGKIDFTVKKSIIEKDYTKEEIKQFTAIEDKIVINGKEETKQITLKETSTSAKLQLATNTLNEGENKDFQIKINLLTENESRDLYKNPTIKILFPKEVTSITDAKYKMLYANGLEKESIALKEENETKFLEMKLTGEQLTYPGEVIDGTEIIVSANVTMNRLMTTSKDNISLTFTNEKAVALENDGIVKQEINAKQSQKIIVTNDIEELAVKTIGKEEDKKIELKAAEESKDATVKIGAINNEGEALENVKILGRFPTKGQTNTMDISLTSKINVKSSTQGTTIYYSSKEDATENLEDSNNGWTADDSLESKRSYLIVISKLENAEKFEAEYGVRINQNVTESKVAHENFEVIYSKNNSGEVDKIQSSDVVLNIEYSSDKIIVTMESNLDDENIKLTVGNLYRYSLSLKNNSSNSIENIQVKIKTNQLLEISQFFSNEISADGLMNIDKLEANEEKKITIYAKCLRKINKNDKAEIYAEIIENYEKYTSNTVTKDIYDISATATINSNTSKNNDERKVKVGDIITYDVIVKNTCVDYLQDLEIKSVMSNLLEVEAIKIEGKEVTCIDDSVRKTDNYMEFSIGLNLESGASKKIEIKAKVKNIGAFSSDTEITHFINIIYDSKVINTVTDDGFSLDTSTNIENDIEIKTIPEEDIIDDDTNITEEVNNTANDNSINNNITKEQKTNGEQEPKETEQNGYKITGSVWIDENLKGDKSSSNKRVNGVKVRLIEGSTGNTVKNSSGDEITTETNSNGEYTLSNIKEGRYIVVFEYDTNKYKPTEYQKEGISQENNSDAILKDILINGNTTNIVATDILTVNKDLQNIDLGLAENELFDLELTKTVTKITVSNDKGTKEYKIKDKSLAKVEIDSKQLNNSKVTIEYSIKVKNTGGISGYAKSIVDYMPSDTVYNDTDNENWKKQGEYLYNTSLENEEIKPGETKEVKLILTKTMTESNTGLVSNIAEIQEAQNSQGITDIDSTTSNRKDGEDDMGQADVIIGIRTGAIVRYIISIIPIIFLAGTCIYLFNENTSKYKK